MLATEAPFPQYFDLDGKPLQAGYLYFGTAGANPETSPITVYWDAAGTQPAAQPIRTINGFPARAGTPAQVFASGDYSLTVRDSTRRQVVYARNSLEWSLSSALTTLEEDVAAATTKLERLRSVLDFPGVVGDGVTICTAGLVAAINAAAGSSRLYWPAGTYLIDDTLRVPSYSYWFGDGAASVIKMVGTARRNLSCVVTGSRADHRTSIVIESLTIDFNRDRWLLADGAVGLGESMDQSALSVCNSDNVLIRSVRAIDAYKHCIDVQAPSYVESPTLPTEYDPEPSYNVWLDKCYASGGGDDNITTHHSHTIWITDCVSELPSGVRVPKNSNCFEIDDGTRNITMSGCRSLGGVRGLQVKGHNYAPAPYNVTVSDFTAVNAIIGVEARHTGYYGTITEYFDGGAASYTLDSEPASIGVMTVTVGGVVKAPGTDYTLAGDVLTPTPAFTAGTRNVVVTYPVAGDGDSTEAVDEDGNPFVYTGASPTARNIIFDGITIVAPCNRQQETYRGPYPEGADLPVGVTLTAKYGFRIKSYENVSISNLTVSDGSLDAAADFEPFDGLERVPVRFHAGCRSVQVKNLVTYGFASDIGNGSWDTTTDTQVPLTPGLVAAVQVTSTFSGGLFVDGLTITDGPAQGFRATAMADNVAVDNYQILGDHLATADSYPIRMTSDGTSKWIGQGYSAGYQNAPYNQAASHVIRKSALSVSGAAQAAQPFMDWIWEEGVGRDLGTGEGAKWSMKVRLAADTQDYTVGSLRWELASGAGDTTRGSDLVIATSTDQGVTETDMLAILSSGHIKVMNIGNYANDAAASAGGVPVGGVYRNGSVLMVRVA